jgi:hypothetical protein
MFNDADDYGCHNCDAKDAQIDRLYDIIERVETERDELLVEVQELRFRIEGLEK